MCLHPMRQAEVDFLQTFPQTSLEEKAAVFLGKLDFQQLSVFTFGLTQLWNSFPLCYSREFDCQAVFAVCVYSYKCGSCTGVNCS